MRLWGFAIACALVACGDDGNNTPADAPPRDDATADAPVDVAAPVDPTTLVESGLCTDGPCTQLAAGIRAYTPQYELYTDGAVKRRWIYLPPGTTIDTSDMNHWKFPVGTRLWKEFARDGKKIETRFMEKRLADDDAPGAWFFVAFAWNEAEDATTLAPPGTGVMNANGTAHDIPTRTQCRQCHEGLKGRVLGFGAMSLDFAGPAGHLDLEELVTSNLLSAPPSPTNGPYFPLPGTAAEKAAWGYLHANCATCHNPQASNFGHTQVDFRLDVTKLGAVTDIPAHETTVGVQGSVGGPPWIEQPIVAPGDPDGSGLIQRMNVTVPGSMAKMPQLGTEIVDPAGLATLRAWIDQLGT